jgi:acetoin utilization deacetylase AcuC-like enzyme
LSPIAIYYHPVFLEHDTGEHPENMKRLVVATQLLKESGLELEWVAPELAPVSALARVHDADYIEAIRQVAEKGGGWMDMDTVVSPGSYEAALRAAGAGVEAVERALETRQNAFLLVRPPGHHACRARAMGFCLFNNIAVAAAHALDRLGIERVLIVDWDVHHGNGTQAAFYGDSRVLFFSMHQAGHYPGTGMAREVGEGKGKGFTINVPVQPGSGDGAVHLAFETLLLPVAKAFVPQLVLVSAGYDCQRGDLLGGLSFSEETFQWMAACLLQLGEETGAAGPICTLEGGYVPQMEARSIVATLRGMQGEKPVFDRAASSDEAADVREALEEAKPYWKGTL